MRRFCRPRLAGWSGGLSSWEAMARSRILSQGGCHRPDAARPRQAGVSHAAFNFAVFSCPEVSRRAGFSGFGAVRGRRRRRYRRVGGLWAASGNRPDTIGAQGCDGFPAVELPPCFGEALASVGEDHRERDVVEADAVCGSGRRPRRRRSLGGSCFPRPAAAAVPLATRVAHRADVPVQSLPLAAPLALFPGGLRQHAGDLPR